MRMNLHAGAVSIALASILLASCSASKPEAGAETAAIFQHPTAFRMVLGEGGGVAGQWSGYTVAYPASDRVVAGYQPPFATVSRWEGAAAERNPRHWANIDSTTMDAIWRDLLASSGLLGSGLAPAGEYTAFLEVETPSTTFSASWLPTVESIEEAGSVERLYRSLRARLDTLSVHPTENTP